MEYIDILHSNDKDFIFKILTDEKYSNLIFEKESKAGIEHCASLAFMEVCEKDCYKKNPQIKNESAMNFYYNQYYENNNKEEYL